MKTIQSLFALGLTTACALPAFAQDAAPTDSGLLGKRYVEASFIVTDTQHVSETGYGLGASVNMPITSNVDAGVLFTHNWSEGGDKANEF